MWKKAFCQKVETLSKKWVHIKKLVFRRCWALFLMKLLFHNDLHWHLWQKTNKLCIFSLQLFFSSDKKEKRRDTFYLKVSNFQNEFVKSSFLPKIVRISALHTTRQKFWQFFVHILGETINSWFHSEIYWTLVKLLNFGNFYNCL